MKPTHQLLAIGTIAALGLAGYLFYQAETQNAVVLGKLTDLETRLAANNRLGAQANAGTLRGISVAVYKNHYQLRDAVVLKQSQQIVGRTKSVTDSLHLLQQLLREAAHEAAAGPLAHPNAPVRITEPAGRLTQQLNRYTAFIRQYVPEAQSLTQALPAVAGTAGLYSDRAAVAVALANLAGLEATMRHQAADALSRQAQKIASGCCMCFDKIEATAVAAANTIAPNAVYEARLFLTQSASTIHLDMQAQGKALMVQPNGRSWVEIPVPPRQPDQPDTVRARWQGSIRTQGSLDTIFQLATPYLIVKRPAR